jgi:hypothetical protein
MLEAMAIAMLVFNSDELVGIAFSLTPTSNKPPNVSTY